MTFDAAKSIAPDVNRLLSRLEHFEMEDRLQALDYAITCLALRGLFTSANITTGNVYAVIGMLDAVSGRVKDEYRYQASADQPVSIAGQKFLADDRSDGQEEAGR